MKLSFYDPGSPTINDYLTDIYFDAIRKFCSSKSIVAEDISDLSIIRNSIVLTNAHWLTTGVIPRLKENGNTIVSFDINDQTDFTHVVPKDEIMGIDLIFKVSGIQKTKASFEMRIDNALDYTRWKKPFLYESHDKYFEVVNSGKVLALPHVPWEKITVAKQSWADRKKIALVRGGHHYQRVHLLLQLLSKGLADGLSMFPASMYVEQYCEGCQQTFEEHGKFTFDNLKDTSCRLKYWMKDFKGDSQWHNQSVPRYFDIARLFNETHGGIDFGLVEKIFNGGFVDEWMDKILSKYVLYADMKWIYSIYTPPRFWEAAASYTINFMAERSNDQEQFPAIKDGVHYLTYKEDFSNLKDVVEAITKEQFDFITHNCFELYDKWIRQDKYKLSENLLQYIIGGIEKTQEI